jgi:cytochrome c peroxidase
MRHFVGRAAAALLLAGAAAAAGAQALLPFTDAERAQIIAHGPWPPPPVPDVSNRLQGRAAAVAFGRQLFKDPRLSRSGALACASCHRAATAFQDGQPTAETAGRGERGIRNTPSLLDVAGQRWFGWAGGTDSLWTASLAPLLAAGEMGHDVASLAARFRTTPDLAAGYRRAVGAPLPADDERLVVDVAKLLAAFQATLASPRTPFDAFRDALARGDVKAAARYPLAAQRGLRLFIGHGRCSVCHAGPAFSNGEFADIGIPFFVASGGVDPGRHAGLQALQASRYNRLGAFNDAGAANDPQAVTTQHVVLEHRHFGEFRVPGLRQLAHTAPFMHNGSLPSIEAVVHHYSELDENRLHADGERILRPLKLSAAEAADLAAFLRSLSSVSGPSGPNDPKRPNGP